MKYFKTLVGSLVEDAIYNWTFQANNEEEAFYKAYKHWENKNYVDHGTIDVIEISPVSGDIVKIGG